MQDHMQVKWNVHSIPYISKTLLLWIPSLNNNKKYNNIFENHWVAFSSLFRCTSIQGNVLSWEKETGNDRGIE